MRILLNALLTLFVTSVSFAQGQAGPVLTLDEAIQLALRSNPGHQQQRSARASAGTQLRSAYGALMPQVSSSFQASFREGRQSIVEGQAFGAASDIVSSAAGLNVGMSLSAASLMGPRYARANLEAAELDVTNSEQTVRANVVQQYLTVLQAQATAALQDTLLVNLQAQLELARAKQQVGAATTLDVRNAEVGVAGQQVAVLRERNNVEIAMMELFTLIGVPTPANVRLVTTFTVSEPTLQLDELLDMARRANPALTAIRSRESAANVNVARARSAWTPSLSLGTGINGYTSEQTNIEGQIAQARLQADATRRGCFTQDSIRRGAGLSGISTCGSIDFTPAQANAIREANNQFPFSFTRYPLSYSATLSFPIFDGFRREQNIEQAALARNDARYSVRGQELRLTADVTTGYRSLLTAHLTVRLNEQRQQAAREALQLAQERYRVGASTFLEVTQAQSNSQTAGTDLINSIYAFHKAYAVLERAVGRTLR